MLFSITGSSGGLHTKKHPAFERAGNVGSFEKKRHFDPHKFWKSSCIVKWSAATIVGFLFFPLSTMSFCNQIPAMTDSFATLNITRQQKRRLHSIYREFPMWKPVLTFQAHTKAGLGNDLILAFPEPYSQANAIYSQYINLLYSIFGVAFEAKCDKGFFSTFFKKGVDKNKFTWYNNKADSGQ